MRRSLCCLLAVAIAAISPMTSLAEGEDVQEVRVQVGSGANGGKVTGSLQGYETIDYKVRARSGKSILVQIKSDNPSNRFNFIAPGVGDLAMFDGSIVGNRMVTRLPETGDYIIRVYLLQNAARNGESANFDVEIAIARSEQELAQVDRAKHLKTSATTDPGNEDSPSRWSVAGSNKTLLIRGGPSLQDKVIGKVTRGMILQNRGCRMIKGREWCNVAPADGEGLNGWAIRDSLTPVDGGQ